MPILPNISEVIAKTHKTMCTDEDWSRIVLYVIKSHLDSQPLPKHKEFSIIIITIAFKICASNAITWLHVLYNKLKCTYMYFLGPKINIYQFKFQTKAKP